MIKKIKFTANNQTLKGTLVFPKTIKSKLPAILLVHGWTSSEKNYIPRAQALSKLGYICLTFNLRGHGSSEGKLEQLSRQDHLQDVIAAYDFLISQKGVDKKQVGVIGSSYGGYMASLLTAKRKIKWLVLRAPALYPDSTYTLPSEKIKRTDSLEYFKTKVSKVNNKALKSLSKYTGDLLMIESGKDEFIPHQTIQNYINTINPKASFNHIIIKGADHALSKHTNNKKYLNEFIAILQDHFLSKLSLFTEKKVITINTAKEKLLGIKTIPNIKKQKYPCVVLVHGFGVTKHESGMFDNIASYLAEAGIVSFRFDFSGCGESEGDYSKTSLTKLKNDLA